MSVGLAVTVVLGGAAAIIWLLARFIRKKNAELNYGRIKEARAQAHAAYSTAALGNAERRTDDAMALARELTLEARAIADVDQKLNVMLHVAGVTPEEYAELTGRGSPQARLRAVQGGTP